MELKIRRKLKQSSKKDIDAINEELPIYKQMLRIIVTDEEMIKTTTGKVKEIRRRKEDVIV